MRQRTCDPDYIAEATTCTCGRQANERETSDWIHDVLLTADEEPDPWVCGDCLAEYDRELAAVDGVPCRTCGAPKGTTCRRRPTDPDRLIHPVRLADAEELKVPGGDA